MNLMVDNYWIGSIIFFIGSLIILSGVFKPKDMPGGAVVAIFSSLIALGWLPVMVIVTSALALSLPTIAAGWLVAKIYNWTHDDTGQ